MTPTQLEAILAEREAIARIVDPKAWQERERLLEREAHWIANPDGLLIADSLAPIYRRDADRAVAESLDKADQIIARRTPPSNQIDEFMSVTLSRDGVVQSHNAFDANFDEMVEATRTIIETLQTRLDNRLKCPFAAGKALRETPSTLARP